MVQNQSHSPRFAPGNQAARQPRLSAEELAAFRQQVRAVMDRLGWEERDMDTALDYPASQGKWTRQILRDRHPSRQYRQRFAVLRRLVQAGRIPPKPGWAPLIVYDPGWAPVEASVPLQHIVGEPRQCAECAAQLAEGRLADATQTWWVFSHPRARVCPAHRNEYRRRQAWFRRCRALGCPHAVPVAACGSVPPIYTCREAACSRRRWPWLARAQERDAAPQRVSGHPVAMSLLAG